MKKCLLILVSVMLLAGWSIKADDKKKDEGLSSVKTSAEAGFSSERLNRIDDYLKRMIDEGILPHAEAFIARGGKVVYHKSFGWRGRCL